jgi:predicted transglutaminase-like cysteine proteinase
MARIFAAFMCFCASLCAASLAQAEPIRPMISVAFERADPMWSTARHAIEASVMCLAARKLACAPAPVVELLDGLEGAALPFQLDAINRWFNHRAYVSDTTNWRTVDHWEPINEFLSRGGDCEDFAIAKYAMLRALGVPADTMRLLIVEDRRKREIHAVLAVDTATGTRLLDNQLPDVAYAADIENYRTRVAINETGLWRMPDLPLVSASASRK